MTLLFHLVVASASVCILDRDCRSTHLADYNSLYCINNTCQRIRRGGEHCTAPSQCASFSYYGPLACSAHCKAQSECANGSSENTPFCCKTVPLRGECSIDRPGQLSGCAPSHVCSIVDDTPVCVEKKGKSWAIGAGCSVVGNIMINLGVNLQKLSYTQQRVTFMSFAIGTLILGSIIYAAGKIISFSAYIFGSQSMLAGLSATGLISNSLFAPLINNEKFTWRDAIAIILVLVGSTIILNNTSRSHVVYSLCELLRMYRRSSTILWLSFIFCTIVGLFLFIKFVEINSDWEIHGDRFQFLRCDIFFDEDGIVCTYIMVFAYVLLSSFIASFTTLSAKSLGEMVDNILGGDRIFGSLLLYFFLTTLVGCTLLQIYWLNRALKHFDALLVVPIFHISWTILSILTAGIYFQDFDHYSSSQLLRFLLGVLIVFSGSVFLGTRITNNNVIRSRDLSTSERHVLKND